ncbi:MAG: hypothetical protein VX899_14120 [Myxococcota bacterium]|nr:hypothetical protein [Myxococcota bacterium]
MIPHLTALSTALVALGLLTACPQSGNQQAATPGAPGQQQEGGAPMGPEGNTSSHPDDSRWSEGLTDGVSVQGTIAYAGELDGGSLRIDILTKKEGGPPHLVSAETLGELGAFSISAPRGFGEVHLVGFIDRSGDGPSSDDPAATAKVEIGDQDVTGVTLTLSDEPDLGELAPGAPPEGAPDAPPQPEDPNAERNGAEGPAPEGAPAPDGAPPPDGAPEGTPAPGADAAPPEPGAAPE